MTDIEPQMDKRKQVIEIVPYDPNWPHQFAEEAAELQKIFSENFIIAHHIGSTAVPGLSAKPTIDIILIVKNIELVDQKNKQMEALGYEAWGEYQIPGRRFFVKGEEKRTHHVHTFESGHPEIEHHLIFRDYLKSHPNDAEDYVNLKIKLAHEFANNRRGYVKNKQDFVKALLKKAMKWAKYDNNT